jgi:magnesium and cobalt transporter
MEPPSRTNSPSLIERLSSLLLREPEDREQLLNLLHGAFERHLMDADALSIIEGALGVADLAVRDIMVPRAQMDVIDIDTPLADIVKQVITATHSRFPVVGDGKDDVIGILLAKELLRHFAGDDFDLRDSLRPAVFVPNHMAIVVDEYGGVAGLVTIEDVLEQIVGDIEDEYDFDEAEDNIVLDNAGRYRVKAVTEIEDINAAFGTHFPDDRFDTIGGLIMDQLGRLPKRNEIVTIGSLRIQILRADSRRVHTLLVDRVENAQPEATAN